MTDDGAWAEAKRAGSRLARIAPGRATFDDVLHLRDTVHASAERAAELLPALTGLDIEFVAPVAAVTRERWVRATLTSLAPHLSGWDVDARGWPWLRSARARAVEVSLGAGFAVASRRVLATFDPLAGETGRLLVIAPNVLQRQATAGVSLADLCLWISLHEQTHQAQFRASNWLRGFLPLALDVLSAALEEGAARRGALTEVPGCGTDCRARNAAADERSNASGLLRSMPDAELRHAASHVLAVMALLEGHATHVMNAIRPRDLPSIGHLRRTQSPAREPSPLQRLLWRLLGLDEKQAQYRDGERFVQVVVRESSLGELNRVWLDAAALPNLHEIAEPEAWLRRMGVSRGA
ncbi:zinc-dependent metalloprotease [Micrococcales bacterium 31B]|nr:zinc-dependent metalloprotease [Micrococcales bacterium 31B]